jgi:GTP-binding protein
MHHPFTPAFIKSADEPHQFPVDSGREVAVAGRSNSGKSTAINAILQRRKLARISKTPGRTQLINFFDLGEECRIVDLPGYGYAKVPESVQKHWRQLLESYFVGRQSLAGLIVTVDIRRGLNDLDQIMLDWGESSQVPVAVLLTKADKLSKSSSLNQLMKIKKSVPSAVPLILFSGPKKQGINEAQSLMVKWLIITTDT